ncbi:MAG: hypothetical protein IJQ66_07710 [Clostridia bacterium]|nr:hypothetical protein [Clostridia bacterium]
MDKRAELDNFLQKSDDLLASKYIVADIKIITLLKSIATSDTLVAIFKNCLSGFDYEDAKKKYLVKSKYLADDKGEFILPSSSRDLLAFIFSVLVDIDARRIDISHFLDKYFYEDGSYSAGYNAFLDSMIKPFVNTVKVIMENVINGDLQDPLEAFLEEEDRKKRAEREREEEKKREKELSEKSYGESIKAIRQMLLDDKIKVKNSSYKDEEKESLTLIIDMFASAVESGDKDALLYSYTAYKYMVKARRKMFFGRGKKMAKYFEALINAI